MNISDKIYFSLFLKENVIIFDVYEYIGKMASDTVDYLNDWNLIKNDKVVFKRKLISDFLNEKISNEIEALLKQTNKMNLKILFLFCFKEKYEVWNDFFDKKEKFVFLCKNILKQKYKNVYDIDSFTFNLNRKKCTFNGIPCFIPTGDEEELFSYFLRKMK